MNKFESFTPLMNPCEFKLIEKYLSNDDVLLEYGAGNSTIYFSGIVKKVISIEHDLDYYNTINMTINAFNIKNIDFRYIPPVEGKNRKEHLVNYINLPIKEKMKFNRVLIDGRGRKYCAEAIVNYIDKNTIVFIHDFNFSDVEGYEDPDYFNDILSNYDIIERVTEGRGIVALRKK
jgi:hypothetical protein